MENNITTMKSEKFGTVRRISEKSKVLYCASDIAKALGYSNAHDAVVRHCRASVKRATPISGKIQDINFIPEADVYRLICHSKLPSALEFEKWVFEDVVPKAVDKQIKPERPALETAEYHYFPKTFKGEPVITVSDFAHFTGISSWTPYKVLKKVCVYGEDWLALSSEEMSQFKRENPSLARNLSYIYVIKASGVKKLLRYFGLSVEIPMIKEKKAAVVPVETVRLPKPRVVNTEECIATLNVLNYLKSSYNEFREKDKAHGRAEMVESSEKNISAIELVMSKVGILLAAGC